MPVKARQLVVGDARILHAASRNVTDERRTLVLAWHTRTTKEPPAYWTDEIPALIANRDPDAEYEMSRIPGTYL